MKKFKLTPYRFLLLISIFSFVLPSLFSPLSGESYEVLGYLYKEALYNYYTIAIMIFIILISWKPIKKYSFLLLALPVVLVFVFFLRTVGLAFSTEYTIFDYDNQQFIAEVGSSSPSRVQFIDIYEFDGKHKSINPIIGGWTKDGFNIDDPFKLNSVRCYINNEEGSISVDCSYYGITQEELEAESDF